MQPKQKPKRTKRSIRCCAPVKEKKSKRKLSCKDQRKTKNLRNHNNFLEKL